MANPPQRAHILGLALDATDGHKRITRSESFSIVGGSEATHEAMTETLVKTCEDLRWRGKTLETVERDELRELILSNTPH